MNSLPPELARARELLRVVTPAPGASDRVYRRVMLRPSSGKPRALNMALAAFVSLSVASAAYGLALAMKSTSKATVAGASTSHVSPELTSRRLAVQTPRAATSSSSTAFETPALPLTAIPRTNFPVPQVVTTSARRPTPAAAASTSTESLSELGLQVTEYRQAVSLLKTDPISALEQLQVHRKRWPRSALGHEVDLRVVQTLVVLQRRSEAQAAAWAFLRRYPNSARAEEVRRIARPMD